MDLDHTDLAELGDDRADDDYKQESEQVVCFVVGAVGDRIVGLHMGSLASCTAAMLDMDSHMATAANMEVMVMGAGVMSAKAQSQKFSSEQETL